MIGALKTIWNSKYGNLVVFLTMVTFVGIFLYFARPSVSTLGDLNEINGTIDHIDRVLVYRGKIKKNERDSTFYIFLREYPAKFQVSYMSYDKKDFIHNAKIGDSITLHIASEELNKLYISNEKIRSFSLKVNDKVYLSPTSGVSGFGKGYFELGLIIISLTINIGIIRNILRRNKTAANTQYKKLGG